MPADRVTRASPIHYMLVLDDSESMTNFAKDVNAAIQLFLEILQSKSNGGARSYARLTVLTFGAQVNTALCEYVGERDIPHTIKTPISGRSGSTNAAAAFEYAHALLQEYPGKASDFCPYVLFLSDGAFDNEDKAVIAAEKIHALNLQAGKPRIIALGFGDARLSALQRIASKHNGQPMAKLMTCVADLISLLPIIGSISVGNIETIRGADMLDAAFIEAMTI